MPLSESCLTFSDSLFRLGVKIRCGTTPTNRNNFAAGSNRLPKSEAGCREGLRARCKAELGERRGRRPALLRISG